MEVTWFVLFLIFAVPIALLLLVGFVTLMFGGSNRSIDTFRGKHVFITGGSMGLGRALALDLVNRGAFVTIVARGQTALEKVIADAQSSNSPSKGSIALVTGDTTNKESIQNAVAEAVSRFGPIDVLIPNAGSSKPQSFVQTSIEDYRWTMELNYFGTLNTIYAVIPGMIENEKGGTICFVTSACALTSYVGYTSYAPTKYAVRGLCDSLRNELIPYNIKVHMAYPANMNTPGFENEQLTKPFAAKTIEKNDTIYEPHVVAKSILDSLLQGKYSIYCGDFGVSLLGVLANGMSPRSNAALDILFFPIALIIAYFVRSDWDKAVVKTPQPPRETRDSNLLA